MTNADVYDHGFTSAIKRIEFEEVAGWYALGCICSDSFLRTYEHLERGYAEGMRIRAAVTNVANDYHPGWAPRTARFLDRGIETGGDC